MRRLSPRLVIGLVLLAVLAVAGYTLLRGTQSAAVSSSGSPRVDDWPMEGHDPARTRAVGTEIQLPISGQLEVRVADDKGIGSPVAISGNVMLVEAENRLRAVDLDAGKEIWTFLKAGRYISPAADGGTAFIRAEASNAGQVYALDMRTGKQLWAFKPKRLSTPETGFWGGHLSSPIVEGDTVYVGAGKELYALDVATGKVRWEHSGKEYITSSAAAGDGRVFISDREFLYAIDQRTGALTWKKPTKFAVYFSPIVANGTVFVTDGDEILALSTADGAKRWETSFGSETLIPGAVRDSRLFVKSTSALYALDVSTGREIWRFSQPNYVSLPAVAGRHLFAATGTTGQMSLVALDAATGKSVWNQSIPTMAPAPPVIAGSMVYVRTIEGRVFGLSR